MNLCTRTWGLKPPIDIGRFTAACREGLQLKVLAERFGMSITAVNVLKHTVLGTQPRPRKRP